MNDNAAPVAVIGMICTVSVLGIMMDGFRSEAAQTDRPARPRLARSLSPERAAAIATNVTPGRAGIPSPSLRPPGWAEPQAETLRPPAARPEAVATNAPPKGR